MATLWNNGEMADPWAVADRNTKPGRQKRPFNPPRLTINLSLPPEHRYDQAASFMKQHLDLPKLFNSILDDLTGPEIAAILKIPIHLLMRRLHSDEEDAELRGISRATGVPRALLVMFNVFVDMIMGCTSGGARVTMPAHSEGNNSCVSPAGAGTGNTSGSRMLHFRTLDWSGAKLRRIIIELEFVASEGGPVVARTLTYFGYVGVLTGVRRGLSVSLNRRPRHDRSTLVRRVRYRCHQALVVFGLRPGISSLLRGLLFNDLPLTTEPVVPIEDEDRRSLLSRPNDCSHRDHREMTVILQKLQAAPSTAAYLILCTPDRVYNIEKDHRSASWTSSSHFIITCNNDVAEDPEPEEPPGEEPVGNKGKPHPVLSPASSQGLKSMEWLINGSVKRKRGVIAVREGLMATRRRKNAREHDLEDPEPLCPCGEGRDSNMAPEDLLVMVKNRPMSNSQTQYAVIMDPLAGAFVWRMAYAEKHRADGGE